MGTRRSLRASLWWAANGNKCLPLLNKLDFKLVTWRWKVVDFVIHHPSDTLVWQPGSDSERKGQENDAIPFVSDLSHSVTQAPNTAEDRNSMENSLLCIYPNRCNGMRRMSQMRHPANCYALSANTFICTFWVFFLVGDCQAMASWWIESPGADPLRTGSGLFWIALQAWH